MSILMWIFTILTDLVTLFGIVSLFWTIFGIPVGIILFIANHFKKTIKNKKQVFWMCFGGFFLFVAVFILYFVLSIVQGFLGFAPLVPSLP